MGRGEIRLEKGGKGGVTPPLPPPKRRQDGTEGGGAPPAVKAKGGETPREASTAQAAQRQALQERELEAAQTLAKAGYPDHKPSCRSRQKPSPALTSFLRTRKGLNGEDLVSKLGPVTAHPGHWYKFPFSAPNKLDISDDQADTGFHGTHLECMRAILATGMLLPSDPGIIGTRAFADRGGVYLHGPSIAISPKIIARSPDMAPNASSLNISSRFASMQGEQSYFDSVKIVAVHLRIATKENLRVSEYLMEWAGALELPLSSAKQAFYRPLKWRNSLEAQPGWRHYP